MQCRCRGLVFVVLVLMVPIVGPSVLADRLNCPAQDALVDRAAYIDDATAFQALQDAVDAGGTVHVTGVFALRDDQSLIVGQLGDDVTIKASPRGATLMGGANTIRQIAAVRMTIDGLTVLGSRGAYVRVDATSGTTIRKCRFTGLLRPAAGHTAGVRVVNLTGVERADLVITDNDIHAGDTTWSMSNLNVGILVDGVQADLNASIAGNLIEGAQTAGVLIMNSSGAYTIEHNEIIVSGDPAKGPFLWAGGVWSFNKDRSLQAFVVAQNEIRATRSAFAVGHGVFLDLPTPPTVLVQQNTVHMTDGVYSTLLLHGNVDDSVWMQNTVTGSTVNVFAVLAKGANGAPAEGNLFTQNDLDVVLSPSTAHPSMGPMKSSHLFLSVDADRNFAKWFGTLEVVDLGQENIIR